MNDDILEKIEKLAILKEQGILTEEEFDEKKQILLTAFSPCNKTYCQQDEDETYWLSIPSMILGIFVMLACFDESNWDKDALVGASFFIILSLTLGIISISIQKKGKGMAIAGITLSILSALTLMESLTTEDYYFPKVNSKGQKMLSHMELTSCSKENWDSISTVNINEIKNRLKKNLHVDYVEIIEIPKLSGDIQVEAVFYDDNVTSQHKLIVENACKSLGLIGLTGMGFTF